MEKFLGGTSLCFRCNTYYGKGDEPIKMAASGRIKQETRDPFDDSDDSDSYEQQPPKKEYVDVKDYMDKLYET